MKKLIVLLAASLAVSSLTACVPYVIPPQVGVAYPPVYQPVVYPQPYITSRPVGYAPADYTYNPRHSHSFRRLYPAPLYREVPGGYVIIER